MESDAAPSSLSPDGPSLRSGSVARAWPRIPGSAQRQREVLVRPSTGSRPAWRLHLTGKLSGVSFAPRSRPCPPRLRRDVVRGLSVGAVPPFRPRCRPARTAQPDREVFVPSFVVCRLHVDGLPRCQRRVHGVVVRSSDRARGSPVHPRTRTVTSCRSPRSAFTSSPCPRPLMQLGRIVAVGDGAVPRFVGQRRPAGAQLGEGSSGSSNSSSVVAPFFGRSSFAVPDAPSKSGLNGPQSVPTAPGRSPCSGKSLSPRRCRRSGSAGLSPTIRTVAVGVVHRAVES